MLIKCNDLPLFLKLLKNHPHDLRNGTTTAFYNSVIHSPFIFQHDEIFPSFVRWFAERFNHSYSQEKGNLTEILFNSFESPQKKKYLYDLDPVGFLDIEAGLSYEAMKAGIEFTCSVLKIETLDSYYRYPYSLFCHPLIEKNYVDDYITNIGFPTLHQYLSLFNVKKEIQEALNKGLDYDITSFNPNRIHNMINNYMYDNLRELAVIISEKYPYKTKSFKITF